MLVCFQAGGMPEKAAGKTSPPGGAPATGAGSMAKENGNKATPQPNPFGGDPMGMDKRIPETSRCLLPQQTTCGLSEISLSLSCTQSINFEITSVACLALLIGFHVTAECSDYR